MLTSKKKADYDQLNVTKQLQYWRDKLNGVPEYLHFYTDKPRSQSQSVEIGKYKHTISKQQLKSLNEIGKEHKISLEITLLSAFQILLFHYTSQEDFVIGFYVNESSILPIRTNCFEDYNFIQFFSHTKRAVLEVYKNKDVSLEHIIDSLNINRNLTYHPIFQFSFSFQKAHKKRQNMNLDMSLVITENADELVLEFIYNKGLFYEETLMRIAKNFEHLLSLIPKNLENTIDNVCIVSDEEYDLIINQWNDTFKKYPDKCVHQLFEEQVERTPNKVAIEFVDIEE